MLSSLPFYKSAGQAWPLTSPLHLLIHLTSGTAPSGGCYYSPLARRQLVSRDVKQVIPTGRVSSPGPMPEPVLSPPPPAATPPAPGGGRWGAALPHKGAAQASPPGTQEIPPPSPAGKAPHTSRCCSRRALLPSYQTTECACPWGPSSSSETGQHVGTVRRLPKCSLKTARDAKMTWQKGACCALWRHVQGLGGRSASHPPIFLAVPHSRGSQRFSVPPLRTSSVAATVPSLSQSQPACLCLRLKLHRRVT